MSDRPMLLKYLTTKMKIILCIFLLCITVSVFGQSQELDGIEGERIEFPAAVKKGGSLMYGGKVIRRVLSGALIPLTTPEYQGRVQWDSSTGLFSLSELRLKDSGVYTVEKDDGQKSVSTFSLTVWKDNVNVSKPHLNVTHNEYRCTVLCAAARGTGATLTLYKNGEKKPYVTSPVRSYPHLDMTVPVESGTYTCEANNSVSRQTSDPLTVGTHCNAERELNSIVGERIEFPAAVETGGSLMYSSKVIGRVLSEAFISLTDLEYQGRVQWDSSTGFFSLSGLRLKDSGVYTVQNTDQNINTIFQLNVYKDNVPVSKPHVSIIHYESCTIECTAERGTEATLSWYREGQKEPYISSRVASAPHLHLPETVESGTYTCEAKNSVSRETSDPLTVGAHCTAPPTPPTPPSPSPGTIVAIFITVVAVFTAGFFAVLYWLTRSKLKDIRSKLREEEMLALPPDETSSNRNHELGTKGEDLNPLGNDKLLSHLNSP